MFHESALTDSLLWLFHNCLICMKDDKFSGFIFAFIKLILVHVKRV